MSWRPPTDNEPLQRYWRNRANMKVRKRRIARNAVRWAGSVAVQLTVAAVLGYAAFAGFGRFLDSGLFALRTVDLQGAGRADADAILAALAAFDGHNLFELKLDELGAIVERDPWVRHASVRRLLPGGLRVRLDERVPSAVALIDGSPWVVDTAGRVVGRLGALGSSAKLAPAGPGYAGDLPVLTGLATENDETLCLDLVRGVRMLERLRAAAPRFVQSISDLDVSDRDRVLVRTVQPGPRVLLDPDRVERNVAHYLDLRGLIAQQVGTSEYVDLRWQGRIAVKPLQDI